MSSTSSPSDSHSHSHHDHAHAGHSAHAGHDHPPHAPLAPFETEHEALDPYTFGTTQTCFGCGPHNGLGLRLRFERDGDFVRTRFTLGAGYDGPPGILHGGLQAMIADEVAGWTLVGLRGRIGLTTSLQIRYIQSLRLGKEVVAEGKIVSEEPLLNEDGTPRPAPIATVQVTLRQGERVGAMVRVSFALADVAKMEAVLEGPLPEGWSRLFGG